MCGLLSRLQLGAVRAAFAAAGLTALGALWPVPADAAPMFARQYNMSCAACHAAFPRLNAFGEQFAANNMKLPNWRESNTVDTGDDMLALAEFPPIAFRAQAFVQGREGEEIDPVTGPTGNGGDFDFQAPYLIKLLSSAPLSENISFYFYAIFAEKGGNGEALIEDAWFRHADAFGTGIGAQLGQFQVSDLMFPRETRLTFQDFMVYRMAGITYDRGVLFDRGIGPVSLAVGAVNGNGIEDNFDVNSPGFRRPDNMFDNDNDKSVFGRLGYDLPVGNVNVGVFGLSGEQANATGPVGTQDGNRDTDKVIYGLDVSGDWNGKLYWFAQALWNEWDGLINQGTTYEWSGGFAGADYILSDRWALSLLWNYADAGDLAGTSTVYEGIDINTLTAGASYYFMRNVKGVLEVNGDFLEEDNDADFVGHETKEGYVLVGFDAAF